MKKISLLIVLLFATLALVAPFSAKADGGIFYPADYPVYENGQKAFIYQHDGTEDLVVQPNYRGSAKDFVWVVPTPSEPKVAKASQSMFIALQKISEPDESYDGIKPMYSLDTSVGSSTKEVQIVEEKTIDAFDLVTLKASSDSALSEWMKANGYSFPEDDSYLLSDYISEGWYFVIAKIRPEAISGAQNDLNNGTITPIRFTFKSDKLIYPMKLTRVALQYADQMKQKSNSAQTAKTSDYNYPNSSTDMTLYILSDHRMDNGELSTSWANWIKPSDLKTILAQAPEKDWINTDKKLFLTKLHKYSYVASQMNGDIVLANYKNDSVYPVPFYKEGRYWEDFFLSFGVTAATLILSPLFLFFVILSIKEKYEEKWMDKAKWWKAVLVGLALIVGLLILIFTWIGRRSFGGIIDTGPFVGSALAFMIVEIILAVLTVKDFRRQKMLNGDPLSEIS